MNRRTLLASLTALTVMPAAAQDVVYFRIGTGAVGGAHFQIGALLADAVSNPPGARPCDKGGACGVPGLIALAQSSAGAVANIRALADGRLDAGLVQADVAHWAFHGAGPFAGKGAVQSLRAVAVLFSDNLHVVTRRDAGVASLADLRGKRVSLGEAGSGTQLEARTILAAHGMREHDLTPLRLATADAAEQLRRGEIDAFLALDAAPVPSIAALARATAIALLPVGGAETERLCRGLRFFKPGSIPAGSYAGQTAAVPSLEVPVVLLVSAAAPRDRVYAITRALWHPATSKLLAEGNPHGREIRLTAATEALGVPLHAGAAAYYFDVGLVN